MEFFYAPTLVVQQEMGGGEGVNFLVHKGFNYGGLHKKRNYGWGGGGGYHLSSNLTGRLKTSCLAGSGGNLAKLVASRALEEI